jgi:phosphate butyryltransferase
MFRSFSEIEEYVVSKGIRRRVVLAGSHQRHTLESVMNAWNKGLADVLLIGDERRTVELLEELGYDRASSEILNVTDDDAAVTLACDLTSSGKADIVMKGNMHTPFFLHAILNKSRGLTAGGGFLSQVTVFEYPQTNKLMLMTDCAININPDYNDKCRILENAVGLANLLGIERPKAAMIAPIDAVNLSMPCTVDAALIEKTVRIGKIGNCIAEGPMSFDMAVCPQAAATRGYASEIAGNADILLMPDLCTGNAVTKALTFMGGFETSGIVVGTRIPVIMTTTTDLPKNKYNSILIAIFQTLQ